MTDDAKPQLDADNSDLDPKSLDAIRSLLASEDPVEPQPVAEREAAQAVAAAAPASKRSRLSPLAPQSETNATRQKPAKREKKIKMPKPQGDGMIDQLKAKVMGYRPTPKHIVLAGIALLVLFRPWLVFGLLFLLAFIVVGVFLILGYDGFWRRVMGVARWYAHKHPSRSAELHRKLDNFAVRFDAFLDRFPEGTVDGLYLPDFGDLAEAEARHDEALDRRFENLRETEV